MYLKKIIFLALFLSIWTSPKKAQASFHKPIKTNFTKSKKVTKKAFVKKKQKITQKRHQPRKNLSKKDTLKGILIVFPLIIFCYLIVYKIEGNDFFPLKDDGLKIDKYDYIPKKNRQEKELHKLKKQAKPILMKEISLPEDLINIITDYLPYSDKYIGRHIKAIVNVPTSLLPSEGTTPTVCVQDPVTGEDIPLITEATDQKNTFKVTSQNPIYFPASLQFFIKKNHVYYQVEHGYYHFLHLQPYYIKNLPNSPLRVTSRNRTNKNYYVPCYEYVDTRGLKRDADISYTINHQGLLVNDILYFIAKDIYQKHEKDNIPENKSIYDTYLTLHKPFSESNAFLYPAKFKPYVFFLRESVYDEDGYCIGGRDFTI